jgi:ethanolamine utilization protein EutM
MAKGDALGFVETMGLVAAIEASDAMVKAARVKVKTVVNADAGLLSVICEGDLAACNAAVNAGKAAATAVGDFVSSNLIPRPDADTDMLIDDFLDGIVNKPEQTKKAPAQKGKKGAK